MTMMITINTINLIMTTLISMMMISGLDASHVAHYIAEQEVIALQG